MRHYFAPEGVRSKVMNMSICLAYLKNRTSKFHQIFYTVLPVAMAPSSDGSETCYVLLFLWMTLYFHIMERIDRIKDDAHVSSSSPGDSTGGEACRARLHLVLTRTFMLLSNCLN